MKPTLFLFPNVLDEEGDHSRVLPKSVDEAVAQIDGLIAESEKPARRFLRRFAFEAPKTFRDIPIRLLNEHTPDKQIDELLEPILKGQRWGLISDCGMPCLADPGSNLVFKARQKGIAVETFAGPSSVLLALVLSGLSGQHFTFHGYLPKEEPLLIKAIQEMQKRSAQEKSTHLFIETPYRNQKLLAQLLKTLHDNTQLCVATDLTAPGQEVSTRSVREWKKSPMPEIDKRPTVFVLRG
ncbi:MAG: SAM-dependent methyltransferase [Verrucomicrobia bacterium]|nr:SAM-dependent methyltransferase [Verrucomicrobiota bacterium]